MHCNTDSIIKCQDLGKSYRIFDDPKARLKQAIWRGRRNFFREFWAIRQVNLEVRRGESLGIIGRNGSGKSTLLQLICGTLTPTEGRIQTSGRIAALLELGSGFNPEFTGIENVYLNAAMLGLSKDQTNSKLDDILAFADIGDFASQPVKTYSSGMAVRLAFSVIAHVDADILVVDEAFAVGDTVFVQRCMRFIQRMRDERCLLFVSHDAEAIKSLCSHSLWLMDGRIKAIGKTRNICLEYLRYCNEEIYGEEIQLIKTGNGARLDNRQIVDSQDAVNNTCCIETADVLIDPGMHVESSHNLSEASGWKTGQADLLSIQFTKQDKRTSNILSGGEVVSLEIVARANKLLERPIIGFSLLNKLGQHICGDNTIALRERDGIQKAEKDSLLIANFRFLFPVLNTGEYTLMAAIADGDSADHIIHHWVDDALIISVNSCTYRHGLVGAFLLDLELRCERPQD